MAKTNNLFFYFLIYLIHIAFSTKGKTSALLENASSTEFNNSCTASGSNKENMTCEDDGKSFVVTEISVDSEDREENTTELSEQSNITITIDSEDEDSNATQSKRVTEPPPITELSSVQPPSTTEEISQENANMLYTRKISEDICTCDLTLNSCDINCCCDSDCSEADRRAFSLCHIRTPYIFDSRHCYQTHFIYHNNTELKVMRNKDNLFCIARDNLPVRFLYQNRKTVVTAKEFTKLQKHYRTFSWPVRSAIRPIFSSSKPYTAGGIIWSIRNISILPFNLPVKATSILCQTTKNMLYLNDWSGSCSRLLPEGPSQFCESDPAYIGASYFQNFTFLASPLFINESFAEPFTDDCPSSICVSPTAYLCPETTVRSWSINGCKEIEELEKSIYKPTSNSCNNVVKQVRYVIFHNGTEGIFKVNVYIWFTNLTAVQIEFSQRFDVSFQWARNIGSVFYRSGNPGYIVGKPIMSGRKVFQPAEEQEESEKETIEVSRNPEDWLSVAAALDNGYCDFNGNHSKYYRHAITFGENRLSSCSFPIRPSDFTSSITCNAIFNKVIMLLVGSAIENVTTPKIFNVYVASFGDSKPEDIGDWVQVLLETVPSFVASSSNQRDNWSLVCKGIVTRMHIDIVFAHVGSLTNPQAKILGVKYKFGTPQDIIFKCTSFHCVQDEDVKQYFKVVTSINFVDVTQPAIAEFAEPPVYEVKLPHDFFYPFFSSVYIIKPGIMLIMMFTIINVAVG